MESIISETPYSNTIKSMPLCGSFLKITIYNRK